MSRSIVLPVNGQSNPMFTLIDPTGEDLHAHLMELNRAHADEEVRKDTGEKLVSELERIRDNIDESGQVNRRDMEEVEATSGTSMESYPISGFTERKSSTGLTIALEEIDIRRAGLIAGAIVAGLALLYKIIKWFTGRVRGSAGAGGSGGGGKSGGKSDKEFKAEIEGLENDIKEAESAQSAFNPEASNDSKKKDEFNTDIANYLDARSILVERLITGTPTYSKAFSVFVPQFIERYDKERTLLSDVIDKLNDFNQINSGEATDRDLAGLTAITAMLDDPSFSMHKWEGYQVFMNACGVKSGGVKTLKEATTELMSKFRDESSKPSRLRASDIKGNRLKRVNEDVLGAIACFDDQEDSGGVTNHHFYIPMDDLDKGLNELDKTADEIKRIGEAFREKHGTSYSATSIRALEEVSKIIGKLSDRNSMINFPIMINEIFGKEIRVFLDKARVFTKKYVTVTQG